MKPAGYSRIQISLHWLVFALVALQFILSDYIAEAWYKWVDTGAFDFNLLIALHVFGGILVALLVAWRLALRAKRGTPPLPEAESRAQKAIAHGTHHSLYLLLILMPLTGAIAWFGGYSFAASVHFYLKFAIIALISLHIAAALYHQFVLKTNLLDRMKTARD